MSGTDTINSALFCFPECPYSDRYAVEHKAVDVNFTRSYSREGVVNELLRSLCFLNLIKTDIKQ